MCALSEKFSIFGMVLGKGIRVCYLAFPIVTESIEFFILSIILDFNHTLTNLILKSLKQTTRGQSQLVCNVF